jgi:hypothetical protein
MRKAFTLAALLVLAVSVPGAIAGSTRAADNTQTYLDSTGEDPSAPDITSLVVSNDATGLITFKINISNRTSLTSDMELDVYLDTDSNPSTGDSQSFGAEDLLVLVQGSVGLYKWNGTDYLFASSQSSLVFSYDATGATIRIKASDLGGTKAFNFLALAASGVTTDASGNPDYTNAHADFAPDQGHGTFNFKVLTRLQLTVSTFQTTPASPKAGGTFSASLAVTENDTGAPIKSGSVACSATVAGKAVPLFTHLVTNGVATCMWRVPKSAKGKKLTGKVTVSLRGASTSKSFTVRVR